jgi:Photosystem II Pbs27
MSFGASDLDAARSADHAHAASLQEYVCFYASCILAARLQAILLKRTNEVLAMPAAEKEAAVKELKKEMNSWTAKYRTNGKVGGRASFSNMYSAVNALAGHWNSFGADAPVPKKRMTRITKVCTTTVRSR